jgi:Protein of unknown function (DUF2934)
MAVGSTSNTRGMRKSVAGKAARTRRAASTAADGSATTLIDPEQRRALIAEAAYFRAERRGFAPGHEAEDWLAAEIEVDTALTVGVKPAGKPAVQ